MNATHERTDPEARRVLANEVSLVAGAIDLVASGGANRVTLAGLRFGEQVAEHWRTRAARVGVLLEPLWWPDDTGCDVLVRVDDDA